MSELVIQEGMWEDCVECAIKIQGYFPLFKISQTEESENNVDEANRYGILLFEHLVKLSSKYKCSLHAITLLICNIVELMPLMSVEVLKSVNPIGKIYSTEFPDWFFEKSKT